jgi:hypothetical protein
MADKPPALALFLQKRPALSCNPKFVSQNTPFLRLFEES